VSADEEDVQTATPVRVTRRLLDLQGLDTAIDRLSAKLDQLEAGDELKGAREGLAMADARVGEVRLGLSSVLSEQRRLEGDVDSIQRKIDGELKRLFDGTVANAKELQSIEAEVASLRGRKSRSEDLLIDQMERREDLEAKLVSLESEVGAARASVEEIGGASSQDLVATERGLAERRAERGVVALEIHPELLVLYEEIRAQKKGVGAAALVDGVCGGCHQKLSPVFLDRLKREEGIRRCEYCRRILVLA
jgi:predicted  nucleic acid-binding Zn-ribbon protein